MDSSKSKVKVCSICFSLNDGAGIAAYRIHSALLGAGVETSIAVADQSCSAGVGVVRVPIKPISLLDRFRLKVVPSLPERWSKRLRHLQQSPDAHYELFSLPFSKYKPEALHLVKTADVIHLHWVSGLVDFTRFFQRVSVPIIWTLHDQQPYMGGFHYDTDRSSNHAMASLESACFKLKQDALKGHQLAVVGNSDWNTNIARDSGMFPPGTTYQTIYYPFDTQAYQPRNQCAARTGLGLPTDAFIVGFAATDLENRRKGLVDLLEALRLLHPDEYPLTLLSFGRAPSPDLMASIHHPWVNLGFLDNENVKSLVYSAMDCFVAPSHAEAFGQTVIEALACETPVIASRTGGLIEAVGDAGLLFEPGDVNGLARAICQLFRSPNQCTTLGALGRTLVRDRHDPTFCATKYLSIYKKLLSSRHTV